VLANLLNGSGFNYVILASPNAPDQLMRVVLVKADQPASLSSQSASNQGSSAPEQPKTIGDPLLWAPASDSLSWTPPEEDPTAAVSTKTPDGESVVTPKDPILPEALEQMMKERTRQLREQAQPPQ